MKIENEFSVAASLDETWKTLLDMERVGNCLPGAKIEPATGDGVYRGSMRVKFGPVSVAYQGTATFLDTDEDNHTVSISVQGRETKGQGTASAVITNRLEQVDGKTKVTAITDLKVTGRPAQFGRGIMEDVANAMMAKFAVELEKEIQRGNAGGSATLLAEGAQGPDTSNSPPDLGGDDEDALDMGNVLASTQMVKYGAAAGIGLLVLLLLMAAFGSRSRRHTLNLNLTR